MVPSFDLTKEEGSKFSELDELSESDFSYYCQVVSQPSAS